jgi:hypothetical protein
MLAYDSVRLGYSTTTNVSFDKNITSPPNKHTMPPMNIDCRSNLSASVTTKGEAILPRFDIASTTPVPVVLIPDGNDSVVISE